MKKALIAFLALALCFSVAACGNSVSEPKDAETSSQVVPEYSVVNESEYARDGNKCIGYRVEIGDGAAEEDMRAVFNDVTSDDGYYLHTVWFYGLASDVNNIGFYTAGMLEEEDVTQRATSSPRYTAPFVTTDELADLRSES